MKKFESSNTCLPTEFNTVAGLSQSGLIIHECQSQYNLTKNWDLKANFTNDMQSCLRSCSTTEFHGQIIVHLENSSFVEPKTFQSVVESYFSVTELKIQN